MKKPIYKRWWFWLIIGIILLSALFGNISDDVSVESEDNTNGTTLTELLQDTPLNNDKAKNIIMNNIPNFVEDDITSFSKNAEHCYALKSKFGNYYITTFLNEPTIICNIKSFDKNDSTRYYSAKYKNDQLVEFPYHECVKVEKSVTPPEIGSNLNTIVYSCSICEYTWTEHEKVTEKIKAPVLFKIETYDIDFLGGIDLNVSITNLTDKEVKYYTYQLSLYNAVGDKISSEMYNGNKDGSMVWKITGPVKQNNSISQTATGFYNNTFSGSYTLDFITIDFMDGTSLTINSTNMNDYETLIG